MFLIAAVCHTKPSSNLIVDQAREELQSFTPVINIKKRAYTSPSPTSNSYSNAVKRMNYKTTPSSSPHPGTQDKFPSLAGGSASSAIPIKIQAPSGLWIQRGPSGLATSFNSRGSNRGSPSNPQKSNLPYHSSKAQGSSWLKMM